MKYILIIQSSDLERFWLENKDLQLYYDSLRAEAFIDEPKDVRNDETSSESESENSIKSYTVLMIDTRKNDMIGSTRVQLIPGFSRSVYIYSLFVNQEYRRKGYAELLLRVVEGFEIFRKHSNRYWADVYDFNKASARLFSKLGYEVTNRRKFTDNHRNYSTFSRQIKSRVGIEIEGFEVIDLTDSIKNEDLFNRIRNLFGC